MTVQKNNSRLSRERVSQKNRTRAALVAAAGEIVKAGRQPTVSDAGEAASISRATAYRYFPTQEMLLAEVALFAAGGPLFSERNDSEPLPEAVGSLVRRVGVWAFANEQPLRTLMRLSLDPASGVRRPGHRTQWIESALAGARNEMDAQTYRLLSRALTLLMGIDPVIVMRDIAGASREDALDTLEWVARTLVAASTGRSTSARTRKPAQPPRAPSARTRRA